MFNLLFSIPIFLTATAYAFGILYLFNYYLRGLRLKNAIFFLFSYIIGLLAMIIRFLVQFITDIELARIFLAIEGTCLGFSLFFLFLAIIIGQRENPSEWVSVSALFVGLSMGLAYNKNVVVSFYDSRFQMHLIDFRQPIALAMGGVGLFLIVVHALQPIFKKIRNDSNAFRYRTVIFSLVSIILLTVWVVTLTMSEFAEVTIIRYYIHFLMISFWTWMLIRNPLTFTITEDEVQLAVYVKRKIYRRIFAFISSKQDESEGILPTSHWKTLQPIITGIDYKTVRERYVSISRTNEHLTLILGNKSMLLIKTEKKISFGMLQLCSYFISYIEERHQEVFRDVLINHKLENEIKQEFIRLLREHTVTTV